MHTVKSRENIREAYFQYNVKDFALDTKEELLKILDATNNAKDLNLYVRVAISNEHAEIDLSRKFGAFASEALGLLRLCKEHGRKVGLSFHVGSQCMDKISFSKGIQEIGNIIKKTDRTRCYKYRWWFSINISRFNTRAIGKLYDRNKKWIRKIKIRKNA